MPKPILVVEDNPDIREVLRVCLEAEGFVVHTAENGREALAVLTDIGDNAVIVLDLMMPIMSGWEVLDRLRETGSRCPVIVVSAVGDATSVSPVTAYLRKPLKLDALLPLIHTHAA